MSKNRLKNGEEHRSREKTDKSSMWRLQGTSMSNSQKQIKNTNANHGPK